MEKDTKIETFAAYLIRKCFLAFKAKEPKEAWNKRHRGENVAAWDGKNRQKRERRAAHAINRLAQIRASLQTSDRHVPKLKRIPASVFE